MRNSKFQIMILKIIIKTVEGRNKILHEEMVKMAKTK